jgi:hypothetical protein
MPIHDEVDRYSTARLGTILVTCVASVPPGAAQGHCALRQPEATVFEGFPEADGYRAIVRDVDESQRASIDTSLPFRVHFNELGEHTLYVALRGERPIGFVHARSEESRWGLAEIVWYFELDMTVRRFRFQRVRSRHARALEKSTFAQKLVGLDFDALRTFLTAEGELSEAALPVPDRADSLARTVVRSALKTMVVTKAVWEGQLEGLADLELGIDLFPDGRAARRLVIDASKPSPFGGASGPEYVTSLRAVVVLDGRGRRLGTAAETGLRLGEASLEFRWAFDDDDRLVSVACVPHWPDEAMGARFRELEWRVIESDRGHADEVDRVAAEVLRLVHGLVRGDR